MHLFFWETFEIIQVELQVGEVVYVTRLILVVEQLSMPVLEGINLTFIGGSNGDFFKFYSGGTVRESSSFSASC